MELTKTDFLHFIRCPESLWLLKNKPDDFHKGEFSLFLEKLIKEGYEVESYAKLLFADGINLSHSATPDHTKKQLATTSSKIFFQASFKTSTNVFARVDILEKLEDETYHIIEVKSGTSIKKDQIDDVCFQKYVLEKSGFPVSKVSIIYLNKDYVKNGEINPNELLDISDVTNQVDKIYSSITIQINAALNLIHKESINESECSCKYKTRSNHCDNFSYFNKGIPENNIYKINRILAKSINLLVDNNQFNILDIPLDFKLNTTQQMQVESVRKNEAIIDKESIRNTLADLKFPLHFVDYETFPTAVPKVDGMSPHNHLVFQVSIHTMQENGDITHFEWLGDKLEQPVEMLNQMQEFTGFTGTFVSWYASFEKSRNKDMISWIPKFTDYLNYINENMFDLEVIFKTVYVDSRFQGRSSIKNVLPVLCPRFSYSDLEVQNGTMALDNWGRMITDPNIKEDVEQTRKNLLEYCELDTLAMVEIYKVLLLSI